MLYRTTFANKDGKFRKDKNYFTKYWEYAVKQTWDDIWSTKRQDNKGEMKTAAIQVVKVIEATVMKPLKQIDDINMGLTGTWSKLNQLPIWQAESASNPTPQIFYALDFCRTQLNTFEGKAKDAGQMLGFYELQQAIAIIEGNLKKMRSAINEHV